MTIERFQKRMYLGILAMALIPVLGGVVQFGQVSAVPWQVPFWSGPHQPGTFFGDDPAHFRMMVLFTFLATVALTLAAGFYLVYTFRDFRKNDLLVAGGKPFPGRDPDPGNCRQEKPEDGHSPGVPAARLNPAEIVNNGAAFLTESIPRLASQAAEVVQNTRQVMEQSLLALQRCNELTRTAQEVAAENRRNALEMRRFMEEMAASLKTQTHSFH